MERFVLQKYTFRFGLAIRFVLRIIDTLAAFNIKNAIVNDTSTKKKKITKSKEFFDIVKMKASYNEFCVMERYLLSV